MVEMQFPREDARFRDGHFDTGIDLVGDEDEPPVRDVPEEAVDHFQRYGWEHVDADQKQDQNQDTDSNAESDDTASDSDDSDAESGGDDFDADAFVDRNVPPIAEDLETGDYDDHLDAIEDAERADGSPRNGVLEAIDARTDGE